MHRFGFYPHVQQLFTKFLGVLETGKMITQDYLGTDHESITPFPQGFFSCERLVVAVKLQIEIHFTVHTLTGIMSETEVLIK